MKTTLEILKEARELIAQEGGWGQRHYEVDNCFCVVGAIVRADRSSVCSLYWSKAAHGAVDSLSALMAPETDDETYGYGRDSEAYIFDWNDEDGRTQAEVVAKFDEAIAAEEAKSSPARCFCGYEEGHSGGHSG